MRGGEGRGRQGSHGGVGIGSHIALCDGGRAARASARLYPPCARAMNHDRRQALRCATLLLHGSRQSCFKMCEKRGYGSRNALLHPHPYRTRSATYWNWSAVGCGRRILLNAMIWCLVCSSGFQGCAGRVVAVALTFSTASGAERLNVY